MDGSYFCLFIFLFVAIILAGIFRCKVKCGTCGRSAETFLDFLPTKGKIPTGEGGFLLEGDSLREFDYVDNISCIQCWRDYADYNVCSPYCIRGDVI